MPNIYQQAQSFRKDLEAGVNNTASIMISAYGDLWANRVKPEIDSLTAEIEADIAAGKDPARARLERQARFEQLEQDLAQEMERLRTQFAALIAEDVQAVADRAIADAQNLMLAGINPPPGVNVSGVFNRVNTGAMEQITAVLQPGSPLHSRLGALGPEAAKTVGRALQHGIGLGHSPKQTAREARQALGGNLARAMTIARTETIRAYREASRATYEANKNIVPTWLWLCAKQARTCAVCWSMNGTEHPVNTPQGSHPNCRCTMVPKTISYADLAAKHGLPPPPEGWPSGPNVNALVGNGADLFDKLSDEDKLRILGPSKFAAYQAGALKLGDLVAEHEDPDWGMVRGEKSLGVLGLPKISTNTVTATLAGEGDFSAIAGLKELAEQRIDDLEDIIAQQQEEIFTAFANLKEGRVWGNNQLKEAGLTKAEREALGLYTGGAYRRWNKLLRGQLPPTATVNTDDMNIAIGALNKGVVNQPIVVYRGSTLSALGPNPQVGGTITDNGFMSTSIREEGAFGGQAQLIIEVPTGSRGLYVESVSQRKDEREFLMPPGTTLEIKNIEVRDGWTYVTARVVNQRAP